MINQTHAHGPTQKIMACVESVEFPCCSWRKVWRPGPGASWKPLRWLQARSKMRGRVMKVRTSITEPWMKRRSGSRRSFAATIARESREDHLSRVRFRDSGRRMAWLCHSKLRLGSAIKPAARMRRHDPPERLFTVFERPE